ncbi:alpha/beta hydrolase family protein [Ferruginibacter yonginensis]|uniref:Alpha/beta hydrolase family protein n=1 Tax=Ferruginibacter yonginensis TaxID=1310416 RepID=A0ABV8QPU7_9BACT
MTKFLFAVLVLLQMNTFAQSKKPLTHEVYDSWKSVGERSISNDGKFVVYAENPQEGDGTLWIYDITQNKKNSYDRGYGAIISNDNKFVFFKIKAKFQDVRQAKIKKKRPDEMPKDSFAIVMLGTDSITKIPLVKSFKAAEKGTNWVAYLAEKPLPDTTKKKIALDSIKIKIDGLVKVADSMLRKSLDSIKGNIQKAEMMSATEKAIKEIYKKANDLMVDAGFLDADGDDASSEKQNEGTELSLVNLVNGKTTKFKQVSDYLFDKYGNKLLIETTKNAKDSNSKALVLLYDLQKQITDTVMKGFNDAKNFSFNEEGNQLAFVAERDSSSKALQKFYKLWYHKNMADTATILVDKNTNGMLTNFTVSENADIRFSKDGSKLFFGNAPIVAPKDTNLVDFELARLDVWNYKDDYLQPQQLRQLSQELRRSYTAVVLLPQNKMIQLGADSLENISLVNEGNASFVLAQSTKGNRVASQWEGRSLYNVYTVDVNSGAIKNVLRNNIDRVSASPMGKYLYWYHSAKRQYFAYEVATGITRNVTDKIKVPLYDTQNDVPDYPNEIGVTGFTADDASMLINDEYDIWKVDPSAKALPVLLTNGFGRKNNIAFNYVRTDNEKRFIGTNETMLFTGFNKVNKQLGIYNIKADETINPTALYTGNVSLSNIVKAKNAEQYIFTRATIAASELYTANNTFNNALQITDVAKQQAPYNWLTASLMRWKMFDGKMSEGLLFKPENFDSTKKYPVIFYFYERNADGLYNYRAPAPSASTINIPYFVSNGYLVFDPNIYYKDGEPGQSAYNSIVSAAKMLSKMPWVDSTRMAIQGQSWGGYQVAYLVTKTNIFRAAGAGAPVSNMTSAYGGIRWSTGVNRQFQYEKTQSRIGATLWQRPDLYIKNSPLFAVDKIQTPLLIMHNDADGAVPWYQGIEMFTAMRRMGKKVWMLQYNGEDHNLVERKNRKDLSVRLSQFFDYYLKDAPAADWIKNGVPATKKGIDWGLKVN